MLSEPTTSSEKKQIEEFGGFLFLESQQVGHTHTQRIPQSALTYITHINYHINAY